MLQLQRLEAFWFLAVHSSQEAVCVVEPDLVGLSECEQIDDRPFVVVRVESMALKLPEGHQEEGVISVGKLYVLAQRSEPEEVGVLHQLLQYFRDVL